MNITCSAGKGEMPAEACLSCGLTGSSPCGYDYMTLKGLFDFDPSARRSEIHVTDLVGCLRRAWYGKEFPAPEMPHALLYRQLGTIVHRGLRSEDEFGEWEVPLRMGGLVGTADILYSDGRLLDIKTSRWVDRARLPYGSHALQVNMYRLMLERSGRKVSRMQIQYIDLSGPHKCRACRATVQYVEGEYRCPSCLKVFSNAHLGAVLFDVERMDDDELERQINERIQALQKAMETYTPPEPEPSFLCGYCAWANICEGAQ